MLQTSVKLEKDQGHILGSMNNKIKELYFLNQRDLVMTAIDYVIEGNPHASHSCIDRAKTKWIYFPFKTVCMYDV